MLNILIILFLVISNSNIISFHQQIKLQSHINLYDMKPKTLASNLPDLSQRNFPEPPSLGYDLIVIGSGPGGESIAVTAAQLGAKVAVIEKRSSFGGPTGLTSKAVREAAKRIGKAVDQVGGDRRKQVRGLWKRKFPVLKTEAEILQAAETRDKLKKNRIDLYIGEPMFSNTTLFDGNNSGLSELIVTKGANRIELRSKHVCIATGSRASRPTTLKSGAILPFRKSKVIDATEVANLQELPNAVLIIGGGVIAVEYATVLAELGVGITLICPKDEFMPFLEADLRKAMLARMIKDRILVVNEEIASIEIEEDSNSDIITTTSDTTTSAIEDDVVDSNTVISTKRISRKGIKVTLMPNPNQASNVERRFKVDLVLYSGGRDANSEGLGCENYGIEIGKYGRIIVNPKTRRTTSIANSSVYAIGDVTGLSGLASSAQHQGRTLAHTLFNHLKKPILNRLEKELVEEEESRMNDKNKLTSITNNNNNKVDNSIEDEDSLFGSATDAPMTIWTIPEVSSVGLSYEQAINLNAIPISEPGGTLVEGFAYFKDMARGRLSGDLDGFLKLIAIQISSDQISGRNRHRIVGCQIFGDGANELIQLGSILVHSNATLEQISLTPFAAVTLSGLYQMASDDCLAKCNNLCEY